MSWVHPIMSGVAACGAGLMAFSFWRSLAQEMKRGKVEDLHKRVVAIVAFSSAAFTNLWEAIAPPKPGTTGEYVWQGLIVIAIAAIVYTLIGRRPAHLR